MRNRWGRAAAHRHRCSGRIVAERSSIRAGRRLQESRPARHALLRREQGSGRRCAEGPKKHRDPGTLVFAYTPVEDPAVYGPIFKPFTDYLAQCTGKRVVYYPVNSNSAEIEAMRSGRLHFAGFSTGPTGFAVNLAGAVPFAAKGTEKGPHGYHLICAREGVKPVSKALRPQGQARRPHRAVVEFRPSCAAGALSAGGPQAE